MFPGAKSNLTDVAAQIGIDQLRRLDGFNMRRRELAGRYFEELDGFSAVVLPARGDAGHSWHMFQVLIDFRARGMTRPAFQKRMADRGIGIGVHYPCIPEPQVLPRAGLPTQRIRRWRRGSGARRSPCRFSRRCRTRMSCACAASSVRC